MSAEAFDPFADDDEQHGVAPAAPAATSHRNATRRGPRGSPRSSLTASDHSADADVMKEFGAAFPAMTLEDGAADPFGFPSDCFSATFDPAGGEDDDRTGGAPSIQRNHADGSADGAVFVLSEEMSVMHKSQTNQCSVNVRGNLSLEAPTHPSQRISCDAFFLDPEGHLEDIASKNYDCAHPGADLLFRLSMPAHNGQDEEDWYGRPLIEYTCGDKLRPVPMLVNSTVQALDDGGVVRFEIRVNPRNESSLLNTVVLISVPDEFDGGNAKVSSVGRSIGKGNIDANWSPVTRILSWRLGELYSGAICEFEALFDPSSDVQSSLEMHGHGETKFPVLLRYDSEGSLLSGVDLDFGEGTNPASVKRKFRVYHREV